MVLDGANFNIYVGMSLLQEDMRIMLSCLEQNATLGLPVDGMVDLILDKLAE